MNLDDLMAVWRSQDAAPLHGVNETLLRLALRDDDAKLQKSRRWERWTIYIAGVGVVVGMTLFLAVMVYRYDANGLSPWDLSLPVVAAVCAVISGRAMYANHLAQSQREQRFGESLRDQLNRRIAQLDDQATSARRTSVLVTALMGGVLPAAILVAGWRINQKSISDDGYMLVSLMALCAWSVAAGAWELRRQVRRDVLPRKGRLEALLKDLDTP